MKRNPTLFESSFSARCLSIHLYRAQPIFKSIIVRQISNIRGSQSTGAPFLIVVTLLIVFYIIFLPPSDRQALLENNVVPGSGSTGGSSSNSGQNSNTNPDVVFEQTFKGPGPMERQTKTQYEHDIPSFTLVGKTESSVLTTTNSFVVERTTFSEQPYTHNFIITNPANLRNVILTFKTQATGGVLTVYLNNNQIYSQEIIGSQSPVIQINENQISDINYISFTVSSPGLAFWAKNQYQISDLRIQSDIVDSSGLSSSDAVDIRAVEVQNLRSARLRFEPDCIEQSGKIAITVNNKEVYNKIPDCNNINYVNLPKDVLRESDNTVAFSANDGKYVFDRVQIQTFLYDTNGVTYYFDLDKKLFNRVIDQDAICGEIDGACPAGCSEDVDKDCCHVAYADSYWCEVPTQLTSDRCVGNIDATIFNRCPSGYKDDNDDLPEDFDGDGICGNNDDDICPAACSQYYDKDCCFASGANYFCEVMPVGGVANICRVDLTDDQKAFCPTRYEDEDGSSVASTYKPSGLTEKESELTNEYLATAEFFFVDDENYHTAELVINGYTTNVDTRSDRVLKDISRFVLQDSNYIQIVPKSDFSLVSVTITVEKR